MATHRKIDDVLREFEDTRSVHGGVISDAAEQMGMSQSALQRALFRAKKNDPNLHFTTSHRKARYATPSPEPVQVIDVDAVYADVNEYRMRPSVTDMTTREVVERAALSVRMSTRSSGDASA